MAWTCCTPITRSCAAKRPICAQTENLAAAIVTPFAPNDGILRQIRHLDDVPKLPGYLYHEIRAQAGQPVGLSKGGFRAGFTLNLLSDDADEVRRSVDEIASLDRLVRGGVRCVARSESTTAIWLVCVGIGLLFLARGAFQPYVFPLFEHLGGFSYAQIAMLLNGYVLAQSVCAPLAGWYTDRTSVRIAL